MRKYLVTFFCASMLLCLSFSLTAQNSKLVSLKNNHIQLEWDRNDNNGYVLKNVRVMSRDGWSNMEPAKYQHCVLYSLVKPDTTSQILYDTVGKEIVFPGSEYRYIIDSWLQNTSSVALNVAGENIVFLPTQAEQISDTEVHLCYESQQLRIVEKWCLDDKFNNDIKLSMVLYAKQEGYYSLATPSLVSFDKFNFDWATVPGVFQGNAVNNDFISAFAYGQGIPNRPVVAKERTASTLSALVTDVKGITLGVTAEPGVGRDPWPTDKKVYFTWNLGLSVMSRESEFTPTLYHPVLGEENSFKLAGDSVSFSFRYTLQDANWHAVLQHAINDVYKFSDFLKLKKTEHSLTQRLYNMHTYLVNDSISMWHTQEYKGLTIGAQDYRGGVYGADKDAMKNSDYGAMWMLAKMTNDPLLIQKRLPYAINFKLAQQYSEKDFFYGSAAGQYYLHKSKHFTEEWGPYTEPIATAYYMIMDMGNILLFEPKHTSLREHLKLAADKLLEWMKPNGQWEVAYDNKTSEAAFTDVKDLRPTFYGLLVAYEILKDQKYLDAAIKGANWYVENGVNNGHFLGVCGDTRFSPDFATAQSVQALLSLYEITKDENYKDAAIRAAKIYTASVFTHPIPTNDIKTVNGVERADWEISQVGLSFEHGGVLGSANHRGAILLASHAGMFVRMYSLTNDKIFLDMARAAAIGRDAFVDNKTSVASYYWDSMNLGAGSFPHHAWWQVGWITDYLLAEVELRAAGAVAFPRGFITPKVGPHQPYAHVSGTIFGRKGDLIMRHGLVGVDNPYIEYVTAINEKEKALYLFLMNNDDETQTFNLDINLSKLNLKKDISIDSITTLDKNETKTPMTNNANATLELEPYGLKVMKVEYK